MTKLNRKKLKANAQLSTAIFVRFGKIKKTMQKIKRNKIVKNR